MQGSQGTEGLRGDRSCKMINMAFALNQTNTEGIGQWRSHPDSKGFTATDLVPRKAMERAALPGSLASAEWIAGSRCMQQDEGEKMLNFEKSIKPKWYQKASSAR